MQSRPEDSRQSSKAREVGIKLPEAEWWEVFGTDREQLGILGVQTCQQSGWPYGRLDGRRLGSIKPAGQIVYEIGNQPAGRGSEA
jgi:hypothetical protein